MMRRKDRLIEDPAIIGDILAQARVCRLGLVDGDRPYVVPLNFGIRDRTVYFHSAKQGRKLELIKANPRVCFEVDQEGELLVGERACKFGYSYRSLIGFGIAEIIEDREEKLQGLNIILDHYAEGPHVFKDKDVDTVAVIKVTLDEISAKGNM